MSTPRPLAAVDLDWVHALNETHAVELSSMSPAAFRTLVDGARYARVVDREAAFLLAFDAKPTANSPNFDWFQARFDRFLYIDRVAVAEHARRRGMAKALYLDLFAYARTAGFKLIGCEVNADPPNPGSDAFHAALGFEVAGEARLADRDKTVRYFTCAL